MTPLQIYTHPVMTEHNMGDSHPESPLRLRGLNDMFASDPLFEGIPVIESQEAEISWIARAHEMSYIHMLQDSTPDEGLTQLDGDTSLCPSSFETALHAAGGMCQAVEDVFAGKCKTAFCASRPPGHHAVKDKAMGFCLFNNVFIGARHAQELGLARKIAIVDFDVHHGNGTEDMTREAEDILFISSQQFPFWPGSGDPKDNIPGKILNIAFEHGAGSKEFRNAYENEVFLALETFKPELILISAGFDAAADDPLGGLNLLEDDYEWVTKKLKNQADKHCNGRIVSTLEGGYNVSSLQKCVSAHLSALIA